MIVRDLVLRRLVGSLSEPVTESTKRLHALRDRVVESQVLRVFIGKVVFVAVSL